MGSYDVVGNIAILKFPDGIKKVEKVKVAKQLMAERKSVKTVVEKTDKISGRLRTMKTLFLAGDRTLEALYLENGCKFRLNVETCYFSPRLSNERKEIFSKVKRGERVLVMFAGVGPFSISIAKNSKASEVYSVELGRECSKYANENVKLNKLFNVSVIQGDVVKVIPRLRGSKIKFDRIVMARPNLKNSFLKEAFSVISKNGVIHYYGFSKDKTFVVDTIKERAEDCNKKIRILKVKRAGEIAPYKFRWRVDFKVL